MRAIILAGGKGTRLAPYTTILPKPLLPVGEMPILEIVVRQLRASGIANITFCVGYLGSLIQAYFGDGSKFDVKISYSFEDQPLGTAGPISLIPDLAEPFLVMNGDLLTTIDYKEMVAQHFAKEKIATIALAKRTVKIDFGIVEVSPHGTLENYLEKPVLEHHVSMGIYVFSHPVLNHIETGKYLDLPDLMMRLKNSGHPINTYLTECQWLDIGRTDDYHKANQIFIEQKDLFIP